jgi:serine/threonine protein kinase/tetratricopeptide (TPR) repeat protein
MTERDLFEAGLGLPPESRAAYLDRVCGDDAALRQRLEALLRKHDQAGSFLEQPAVPVSATVDVPAVGERPGTVIGPYKLIEQIGEGGMGAVWMAQQTDPVKRLVALKLIKAGMDSRQVIARFEAERQALALMDHPNIARVLDGGTTGAGRPYFVMDLVKGVPITRYCDEHHLTPRQRLELFLPVCQAVQHAHQKGIIHRDLKPSNVLVALYDGQPVPKVIDFGVAKAAGQTLTEDTLVTGFGAIVGTLEYMSPEQAEINQLDIDTRSDIYALGVLLYELLVGSPPFSSKEMGTGGLLEMLRVIREQEPTKPSAKLSTAEGLPTLAANRGTEPAKLTKLVRGELDWIVMKALEKDRARRYETANGFAGDVRRYLNDEPVLACPPSVGYRLRKFVRRNRGPVVAASAILLCLLTGIVGTTAGLVWALRERDKTAGALIAETNAREAEKQARDKAMAALRDMTDDFVENQLARGKELTDENKEFLRKIIKHFECFAAITTDDAESRAIRAEGYFRVGIMRYRLGELNEAEVAYADALALFKQLAADVPARPEFRRGLARTHNNLGALLHTTGRAEAAEAAFRDALALHDRLAADFPARPEFRRSLGGNHYNLAGLLQTTGRLEGAEVAYGDALAVWKRLTADFPARPEFRNDLAQCHINLGILLGTMRRLKEAEVAYGDALALLKPLAADFPARPEFRRHLARTHNSLGGLLRATGREEAAEAAYRDAIALYDRLAADFPVRPEFRQGLAQCHNNLGILLCATGRLEKGEAAYAAALAIDRRLATDFRDQPDLRDGLATTCQTLAIHRFRQRDFEAAKAYLDEARPHHEAALKANGRHPGYRQSYRTSQAALIHTNAGLGDPAGAKQAAEKLRDLGWDPPGHAYDAARGLALCIPIIQKREQASKEERDKQVVFYRDEAMKMLRAAVARGYTDAAHMMQDAALAPLRKRDDFKKLLAELKAK